MTSNVKATLAFIVGVAVGVLAVDKVLKTKYENISREEIESVKSRFESTRPEIVNYCDEDVKMTQELYQSKKAASELREAADKAKEKPGISQYAEQLRRNGYTNYATPVVPSTPVVEPPIEPDDDDTTQEETADLGAPYVIPPEDFGEFEEFEKISLIFWADRILTDDNNLPVEDVANSVGVESLSTFGEYEDDSVFVRNQRLRCDYEILLDQRRYEDVIRNGPRRAED